MSWAWTGSSFATRGITCGVITHGFCNHKIPKIVLAQRPFHQLLWNFVFFKCRLLSVFCFDTFLQYLITGSLCYCSRNSCVYVSTCYRHNPPFWAAVGSYIFSLLGELQHNCISGVSVGSAQALKSFLGAKVFLAIYKGPAWSTLTPLLKAPGHSLPCLLPTRTQWLPRLYSYSIKDFELLLGNYLILRCYSTGLFVKTSFWGV